MVPTLRHPILQQPENLAPRPLRPENLEVLQAKPFIQTADISLETRRVNSLKYASDVFRNLWDCRNYDHPFGLSAVSELEA